jgi:hypothetical protein
MIVHLARPKALVGLVTLILLISTGCSDSTTDPNTSTPVSPGRVDLPYNPDPPKEARLVATLRGDPELDGGCVWLRQGTIEFAVLWPEGFSADFNPVRLYDGDDNLLVQDGETLELTGSFAAEPTAYQPHRCSIGSELWLAGRVDRGG